MADCLYIIAPAYNEAENIGTFVKSWYPVIRRLNAGESGTQSRLVVVNDGSKDETYEILKLLEKEYPCLTVLTKPNEGHGPALLYGYRYALDQGADYVFQTDSDGQTNPGEFGSFWKIRREYDAVFGNRTHRGDGISRLLIEKILCMILFLYFKVRVPDANAPFRLMSRSYLETYLPKMPEKYNLPNVMLVTLGVRDGRNVCFIPIRFRPRQNGKNSINLKKIVKIGIQALKDFEMF